MKVTKVIIAKLLLSKHKVLPPFKSNVLNSAMDHLAQDLSVALEESESCGPSGALSVSKKWGLRRRTRSTGNLRKFVLNLIYPLFTILPICKLHFNQAQGYYKFNKRGLLFVK